MMRGATWLIALAASRGVAGITDGAGCGATCGERAPTPPPFPRKPRDAADAPPRRAYVGVVGGGPGGALAALLLARQERLDVTLYEKELDVGAFEKRSYSISIRDKGVAALREAGGAAAPERIGEVRSGLAIHYPVGDGYDISRARSAARAVCKSSPTPVVIGCAPPITRRAIRSVSSSVATASRDHRAWRRGPC